MNIVAPVAGADRSDTPWMLPSEALALGPTPELAASNRRARDSVNTRFGFEVAGIGLLIEPDQSGQIVDNAEVYPVPNTAPWLLGLINLRGNLVPVFDLARLSGSRTHAPGRHLLVLDRGESAAGFAIDSLPVSIEFPDPLEHPPPPPSEFERFVRETYFTRDAFWLDADLRALLDSLGTRIAA